MIVNALERGGRQQKLERAAHGKPLPVPVAHSFASGGVEDRNAQPPAVESLELGKGFRQLAEREVRPLTTIGTESTTEASKCR